MCGSLLPVVGIPIATPKGRTLLHVMSFRNDSIRKIRYLRSTSSAPNLTSRPFPYVPSCQAPCHSISLSADMRRAYVTSQIESLARLDAVIAAASVPVLLVEGIRTVPPEHLPAVRSCGRNLAMRYPAAAFRTGNAPGTDEAFAEGVADVAPDRIELVVPYDAHRMKYAPAGSSRVSLEGLPVAAESRLAEAMSAASPDLARLAAIYQRQGRKGAPGAKAAYLLRDAMKVVGAAEVGLAPATVGIFYTSPDDPLAGGTGHTIRICLQRGVPTAFQDTWMNWW